MTPGRVDGHLKHDDTPSLACDGLSSFGEVATTDAVEVDDKADCGNYPCALFVSIELSGAAEPLLDVDQVMDIVESGQPAPVVSVHVRMLRIAFHLDSSGLRNHFELLRHVADPPQHGDQLARPVVIDGKLDRPLGLGAVFVPRPVLGWRFLIGVEHRVHVCEEIIREKIVEDPDVRRGGRTIGFDIE